MHTWEWTEGLGEGKVQLKEIRVQGGFPCKKRNNLLGGAVWKLEEVLVVREVVVQRCILLRAHFLERNLSDLVLGDWEISRGKTAARVVNGHKAGGRRAFRGKLVGKEQRFQQKHVSTVIALKSDLTNRCSLTP